MTKKYSLAEKNCAYRSSVLALCIAAAIVNIACVKRSNDIPEIATSTEQSQTYGEPLVFVSSVVTKGQLVYDYIPFNNSVKMWSLKESGSYLFENVKFTAKTSGTSTILTSVNQYFWPQQERLQFFSYYPNDKITQTSDTNNSITFDVIQPENACDQFDFMTACTDYIDSSSNIIPLQYLHQTAAISLAASYDHTKITPLDDIVPSVTVTKVSIENLYNYKGELNSSGFSFTDPLSSTYSSTASIENGALNDDCPISQFTTTVGGNYENYTLITNLEKGVMFIAPQDITQIALSYTVQYGDAPPVTYEQSLTLDTGALTLKASSSIMLYLCVGGGIESSDVDLKAINPE